MHGIGSSKLGSLLHNWAGRLFAATALRFLMSTPTPGDASLEIYRGDALPPAAPAATTVPRSLEGAYDLGIAATDEAGTFRFTHVMLLDGDVDIRDNFDRFGVAGLRDVVFLPDAAGTPFDVVYVERPVGVDFSRVYLNRRAPTWPTSDL